MLRIETSSLMLALVLSAGCAATKGFPAPRTASESFDASASLPAGWSPASTNGSATPAPWIVHADATAPSGPNVLASLPSDDAPQDGFNLCWTTSVGFEDGVIEARVRADGGEVDQGGGLIWRALGPDDYYICRYNPLESNFRVYLVAGGVRRQLATAHVPGDGKGWHALRVEHVGGRIVCMLDGTVKLEAQDDTQPHRGGVGFWTKADARTSFDDLRVTPAGAR